MKQAVGVDLVEFDQFQGLQSNSGFLDRIFKPKEILYCQGKDDSLPYLAARFATKEAVIKALGALDKKIFYTDIEIVKQTNGSIVIALDKYPEVSISVSLSHGRCYAVAVALVNES